MEKLKDKAAVVGMGVHKFSKDSGITEIEMACLAIRSALDDAGLTPDSIDGFVEYAEECFDEVIIARSMGIGNLTFHGDVRWDGGAACSIVERAAMAVASGVANNVVVVRSVNDSSLRRAKKTWGEIRPWESVEQDFYNPYGLVSDSGRIGMTVRRYMHEYNINRDAFGWVSEVLRENGAKNPNSMFYEDPVTYKDYLASKTTVDPFRELDCSPAIDGAIALIVTSAESAKHLKQKPVYIVTGAQSIVAGTQFKTSYYRSSTTDIPAIGNVGRRLLEQAGMSMKDIDVLQIEDEFTPLVPMQLEELGICERGEGIKFIEGGDRIRVEGELPINTSGGSIGEGNIHGMNHIAEAVRQLRGTSTAQVKDAELVLVATGACGPASGLILRR
ncbi:MAG: lipid-transfer protein [Deltaproteobacteria bacterium]|nr:lipid-transfer protein [Deltaproteobacteria bacterium]